MARMSDADTAAGRCCSISSARIEFTRYSVSEALAGRIPPGSLRDKIVLIGMNTPSVFDERVTPIRRNHRGIEVQALTVHQLLRAALKAKSRCGSGTTGWRTPGCYFGVWSAARLVIGCGRPGGSSPRFALALGALVLDRLESFAAGWWIPLVARPWPLCRPPRWSLPTSRSRNKKQRGQLMQLFSSQVSPDIAQALWEQRDEFLAGQASALAEADATVLFTDLKGFSTTSEGWNRRA